MRHTPGLAVALAIASCAVAGCGSDEDPERVAQPATARTTAASGGELVGTFERKVSQADIDRTDAQRGEQAPGQEKPKAITARLALTTDGLKFTEVGSEPLFEIEQAATSADRELRLGRYTDPDRGSFCGPETPQEATYSYEIDDRLLRLKAVSDRCADRDSILTGEWSRRR